MILSRKYTGDDRQWDKDGASHFVRQPDQQQFLFAVIDAAHDVFEGKGGTDAFVRAAAEAYRNGNAGVWQNTANFARRVLKDDLHALVLWEPLVDDPDWKTRWRVACVLYHDISEKVSDQLFAALRHDRSAKVRQYAIDRYENRPGSDRVVVFKMFDATDPASPGYAGRVAAP